MLTETLANPTQCRSRMSELLFECYNTSSVCYGVDSLFHYYYNQTSVLSAERHVTLSTADHPAVLKDGLIIDSSAGSTCLIPVLDGRPLETLVTRLGIGGNDVRACLQNSLTNRCLTTLITPIDLMLSAPAGHNSLTDRTVDLGLSQGLSELLHSFPLWPVFF